jgi:hypothetical protein
MLTIALMGTKNTAESPDPSALVRRENTAEANTRPCRVLVRNAGVVDSYSPAVKAAYIHLGLPWCWTKTHPWVKIFRPLSSSAI